MVVWLCYQPRDGQAVASQVHNGDLAAACRMIHRLFDHTHLPRGGVWYCQTGAH